MLIPSDVIFRFIEDLSDSQSRSMERAARRHDPNSALIAVGGKDALSDLRNRVQSHVDQATYQSMRRAAKEAKNIREIVRSKSA